MNPIFTFDLEDSSGHYRRDGRFIASTQRYLDFLDDIGVSGTFFVVGKAATTAPALVQQIAARDHEIASHSLDHTQLQYQSPEQFLATEREAKDTLEQITGSPVQGFRAPVFSLTRQTTWALDALKELGYSYSSSTIPCGNPLNGFPGIPRKPFAWPNGIIEFPCPIYELGPVAAPYLGGIYLRYFPFWLISRLIRQRPSELLWTYLHPYDIDAQEPFFRMPGTSLPVSLLLWMKRRRTLEKLGAILTHDQKTRFADLAGSSAFRETLLPAH